MKVAIVSGGGSGIGRAVAHALNAFSRSATFGRAQPSESHQLSERVRWRSDFHEYLGRLHDM